MLKRTNEKETYKRRPFFPVEGDHGRVDCWPGQGWVDWDFMCAI